MIFFLLMLSVLGGSSYCVWRGLLLPASLAWPIIFPIHLLLYCAALVAMVIVITGRLRSTQRSDAPWRLWSHTYFFCFLGLHGLLFTGLLLNCIFVFLIRVPVPTASTCALSLTYALVILGVWIARRGPLLVPHSVGVGTTKLKIAQISDLHIGATINANYVKNVVDLTLAAKPDCIVLTGDIGDGMVSKHKDAMDELARLSAPLGVFLSLGNHEFYWPTDTWIAAFQKAGFRVLIDEHVQLEQGGKEFSLLGLAPMKKKPFLEITEQKLKNLIVLSHYPDRAQEAAENKALLFLAGHTHGGQFWPFSWIIYFFHRYAKGRYQIDETTLYIHRGTGFWGPPLRFGARAEIAIFEIGLT